MSDRNGAKAGAKLSPEARPVGKAHAADAKVSERYPNCSRTLALADQALETGDGAGRVRRWPRTSGIVFDLLYSLDFRRGGETVPRLAAIYGYIGNELLNVRQDGRPLQLFRSFATWSRHYAAVGSDSRMPRRSFSVSVIYHNRAIVFAMREPFRRRGPVGVVL